MKWTVFILLAFAPFLAQAQNGTAEIKNEPSPPKYEMMNFWFVMLIKGANRTQDSLTAKKLQEGHMANMERMHEAGKLLLAGPFSDNGNWRGIFVIKAETKEEVEKLLITDPAIAAGRLAYEIHPWMTAKNCLLN